MLMGYCGLDCSKCEAFIATRNNDNVHRQKVAAEWSKTFNADLKPEHINCEGCTGSGVKLCYCENMCEIRKCALEKKVTHCGECPDFACEQLTQFFKMAPVAEQNILQARG